MRIFLSILCVGFGLAGFAIAADKPLPEGPPRLVNGKVIDGTIARVTPEGIEIHTTQGETLYPWKHLSLGTRNRYELPMLAELKAKAEAEAKAAAAKAAKEKAAKEKAAAKKKAEEAKKKAEQEAKTDSAEKPAEKKAEDAKADKADSK